MLDFQVQVNEIQSLRYLKHHTLDIGQYSRLQMQFSTAFNLCKCTIFFEKKVSTTFISCNYTIYFLLQELYT